MYVVRVPMTFIIVFISDGLLLQIFTKRWQFQPRNPYNNMRVSNKAFEWSQSFS